MVVGASVTTRGASATAAVLTAARPGREGPALVYHVIADQVDAALGIDLSHLYFNRVTDGKDILHLVNTLV